jgi:hypothetical protein
MAVAIHTGRHSRTPGGPKLLRGNGSGEVRDYRLLVHTHKVVALSRVLHDGVFSMAYDSVLLV